MTNTQRWNKIMDTYYSNLSSNFLVSDLKQAGFTIQHKDVLQEDSFPLEQVEVTRREISVTMTDDPEPSDDSPDHQINSGAKLNKPPQVS